MDADVVLAAPVPVGLDFFVRAAARLPAAAAAAGTAMADVGGPMGAPMAAGAAEGDGAAMALASGGASPLSPQQVAASRAMNGLRPSRVDREMGLD